MRDGVGAGLDGECGRDATSPVAPLDLDVRGNGRSEEGAEAGQKESGRGGGPRSTRDGQVSALALFLSSTYLFIFKSILSSTHHHSPGDQLPFNQRPPSSQPVALPGPARAPGPSSLLPPVALSPTCPEPDPFLVAMRLSLSILLSVAFFSQLSSALYFYLEAGANKCFLEELPKDTIVVGASLPPPCTSIATSHAR